MNNHVVKTDAAIGFSTIYEGHNKRTWANYWSPLLTACMCAFNSIMILVYPNITTARPGKRFSVLIGLIKYIRCY